MSGGRTRALVLGIGNILLGDEGVGVAVARELERDAGSLPAGTQVVDGGTLGLDLLPLVETAEELIVIDALELRAEPGTVTVLRGGEIGDRLGGHLSIHQVGVADLMAAARLLGRLPGHVTLVGIQPGCVDPGLRLSPPVEAAIPRVVEVVRRELAMADRLVAAG